MKERFGSRVRQSDRWAYVIVVLVLGALFVFFLLPELLVDDRDVSNVSDRYRAKNDVRATGIQLLGGLVLVVGAYFTARTFGLNREGQITDRFSKAVEHLGSDQLATQLGGIYALERITKSDRHEQGPIMEILCAYVHAESKRKRGASMAPPQGLQTALTVIGRRPTEHDPDGYRLDLSDSDLEGVTMRGSFAKADLSDSRLVNADLRTADLSDAMLRKVDFTKGKINDTVFGRADISGAIFSGTDVGAADFSGAREESAPARWPVGIDLPSDLGTPSSHR
jgi:hypothetical protein